MEEEEKGRGEREERGGQDDTDGRMELIGSELRAAWCENNQVIDSDIPQKVFEKGFKMPSAS